MRILYGCNSQGQGHLSKAAVLVPLLEARGHDVFVISSGPQPPEFYRFRRHRHLFGLEYVIESGRTQFAKTMKVWSQNSGRFLRSLNTARGIAQRFEPELVISDFEPLTASPVLHPRCEVVSLCRQVALLDPSVPLPVDSSMQRRLARTMIRFFTFGVDRYLGYHYEPASSRCVPPIIRPEIADAPRVRGEHLLVYNFHHVEPGMGNRLIDWANRRRQPVRVYGFLAEYPRGRIGHVEFRPSDRQQLLEDLATSIGVIATAGLTLPIEAFCLQKPVCVVPLPGQWEQQVNALHLDAAGIARSMFDWDYDAALHHEVPSESHRLWPWLNTSPDAVLDLVLGDTTHRPSRDPVRSRTTSSSPIGIPSLNVD